MGALIAVLLILLALVGGRVLAGMAIRRVGRSQGVREWIHAYGPRIPFIERDETDESTED